MKKLTAIILALITGGGAFSPDAECTRAQAVTFLWKGGEE